MVYGWTGVIPLSDDIEENINKTSKDNTTVNRASISYNISFSTIHLYYTDGLLKKKFQWIYHVKYISIKFELNNIFESKDFAKPKRINIYQCKIGRQRLKDIFIDSSFKIQDFFIQ